MFLLQFIETYNEFDRIFSKVKQSSIIPNIHSLTQMIKICQHISWFLGIKFELFFLISKYTEMNERNKSYDQTLNSIFRFRCNRSLTWAISAG